MECLLRHLNVFPVMKPVSSLVPERNAPVERRSSETDREYRQNPNRGRNVA
jgi:hypothetical protein